MKGIINRGQFCIIGKLLAEKLISKETIKETLLCLWRVRKSFTFKILGENLFIIEFEEASDKARVLEGRPWIYEGNFFWSRISMGVLHHPNSLLTRHLFGYE